MEFTAYIFDLDGTLVGTKPEYRYSVVRQTLHELGSEASNHDIDRFWFVADRDKVVRERFHLDPAAFWPQWRENDQIPIRKRFTHVYDDVGYLQRLRSKGAKLAILTGAPIHIADFEISLLGKENFDTIVIAHKSTRIKPKPNPHGIEECLALLGVEKEGAVFVGNADEDIQTARNAQVRDVLLDRGENDFIEVTPSTRIYSLYELTRL